MGRYFTPLLKVRRKVRWLEGVVLQGRWVVVNFEDAIFFSYQVNAKILFFRSGCPGSCSGAGPSFHPVMAAAHVNFFWYCLKEKCVLCFSCEPRVTFVSGVIVSSISQGIAVF